jgi:hypothetical protein
VYDQEEYHGLVYFCVSQLNNALILSADVQGISRSVETAIPPVLQYFRKANLYIHPIEQRDGKLAQSEPRRS